MPSIERVLPDAAATEAVGAALAGALRPGMVIFLAGPLGAGKTALTRGLLRALGHQGAVKSPTYTLVESYRAGGLQVHHFDLYRLADPGELEFLGLDSYFDGDAVCLLEWPERGAGLLPAADAQFSLAYEGTGRRLTVTGSADFLDFLLKSIS